MENWPLTEEYYCYAVIDGLQSMKTWLSYGIGLMLSALQSGGELKGFGVDRPEIRTGVISQLI